MKKEKNKKNNDYKGKIIYLLGIYGIDECLKGTFHFIIYHKPKLKEINFNDFNDNIIGYEINKEIIAFIENKYEKEKINKIYKHIINNKRYKKIFEISSLENIISLQTKKEAENLIYICPVKIIFDSHKIEFGKNGLFAFSQNLNNSLYITNDFEINNICPIAYVRNYSLYETNYFFVAGFKKGKQLVSLYRIINNDNQVTINFNSDIPLDIKEKIIGKIIDIKQFRKTGRLLISCSNKYYYYSPPDLSLQMICEENAKLEAKFDELKNRYSKVEEYSSYY